MTTKLKNLLEFLFSLVLNFNVLRMDYKILSFLPSEIVEKIFGYLEHFDILNCFLVSTEWYKFLGASQIFKKKFKLKFWIKNAFTSNELTTFLQMRRLFDEAIFGSSETMKNSSFTSFYDVVKEKVELKSIKRLRFWNLKLNKLCALQCFLYIFRDSLEELEIFNQSDRRNVISKNNFLKLKSLKISNILLDTSKNYNKKDYVKNIKFNRMSQTNILLNRKNNILMNIKTKKKHGLHFLDSPFNQKESIDCELDSDLIENVFEINC